MKAYDSRILKLKNLLYNYSNFCYNIFLSAQNSLLYVAPGLSARDPRPTFPERRDAAVVRRRRHPGGGAQSPARDESNKAREAANRSGASCPPRVNVPPGGCAVAQCRRLPSPGYALPAEGAHRQGSTFPPPSCRRCGLPPAFYRRGRLYLSEDGQFHADFPG